MSFLSKVELIALVLGVGSSSKGVMELASSVVSYLSKQKSVPDIEQLIEIDGIGPTKAAKVLACLEFSNRFLFEYQNQKIKTPFDALPFLNFLKNLECEEFVCLCLDNDNYPIKTLRLTKGLVNQTPIHPREAFRGAILNNSASIMFAHNHPSGNLKASEADKRVTKRLVEVGALVGIPVLDHLIVCKTGFISIKQKHPQCF